MGGNDFAFFEFYSIKGKFDLFLGQLVGLLFGYQVILFIKAESRITFLANLVLISIYNLYSIHELYSAYPYVTEVPLFAVY